MKKGSSLRRRAKTSPGVLEQKKKRSGGGAAASPAGEPAEEGKDGRPVATSSSSSGAMMGPGGSAALAPAVRVTRHALAAHGDGDGQAVPAFWLKLCSTDGARDRPTPISAMGANGKWTVSGDLAPLVAACVFSASNSPDDLRELLPATCVVQIARSACNHLAELPNVVRCATGATTKASARPESSRRGAGSRRNKQRSVTTSVSSSSITASSAPAAATSSSSSSSSSSSPSSVLLAAHFRIVGDLHGQLFDLLQILRRFGPPSPQNVYVFDGDFVDRGSYGLEVLLVLLVLQLTFPQWVVLLRGNHETTLINYQCGFVAELRRKYGRRPADRSLGVPVARAGYDPAALSTKALDQLQEVADQGCPSVFGNARSASEINQQTLLLTNFQWVWRRLPLAFVLEKVALVCHGGLWRRPSVHSRSLPIDGSNSERSASQGKSFPWNRRKSSPASSNKTALSQSSKKPKDRHFVLGQLADLDDAMRAVPEPSPDTALADVLWSDPSPCRCPSCAHWNAMATDDSLGSVSGRRRTLTEAELRHAGVKGASATDMAAVATAASEPAPFTLRRNRLRGEGIRWPCAATAAFCRDNDVRVIFRAHEGPSPAVSDEALEQGVGGPAERLHWRVTRGWQVDHCGRVAQGGACVTVFSAPQYPQFKSNRARESLRAIGLPKVTTGAVASLDCTGDHPSKLVDPASGSLLIAMHEFELSADTPATSHAYYNFEQQTDEQTNL